MQKILKLKFMRKSIFSIAIVAIFFVFIFSSCEKELIEFNQPSQTEIDYSDEIVNGEIVPGQYIVVFNSSTSKSMDFKMVEDYSKRQEVLKTEVNEFLSTKSINSDNLQSVYSRSIDGFSVKLTDDELEKLKKDDKIAYVEPDRYVVLARPSSDPDPTTSGQVVPWGITRVNGGVDATGLVAWIIDSGIDLDHPDLNVDVARSISFVSTSTTPDDQNGHGTHVAGTIAAKDNTIGVIGVAANATVVAVRVLDRKGSGTYSAVISGIDYVAANGQSGDVANMSLGGPVSDALDAAVYNASQTSGVKFCLAAGNESDDANNHSPARVNGPNIYTISAMDSNDIWAYFSNYGNPPVDYCAPGVSIYSTWMKGGYNTISGTSMATPHAAGVLLLGSANTDGTVINDPDGDPDLIIVH